MDGALSTGTAVVDESALTGGAPARERLGGWGGPQWDGQRRRRVRAARRSGRPPRAPTPARSGSSARRRPSGHRSCAWPTATPWCCTPVTLAISGLAWAASGDPVRAVAVLVVATPCPLSWPCRLLWSRDSSAPRAGHRGQGGWGHRGVGRARPSCSTRPAPWPWGRRWSRARPVRGDGLARAAAAGRRPGATLDPRHGRGGGTIGVSRIRLPRPSIPGAARRGDRGPRGGAAAGRRQSGLPGRAAAVRARIDGQAQAGRPSRRLTVAGRRGPVGRPVARGCPPPGRASSAERRAADRDGDRRPAGCRGAVGAEAGLDAVEAGLTPEGKLESRARCWSGGVRPRVWSATASTTRPPSRTRTSASRWGRAARPRRPSGRLVILIDRVDGRRGGGDRPPMLGIARQSVLVLGLSFGAMVLAAIGYLPPVAGALVQEAIDVAVILNALRALGRRGGGGLGAWRQWSGPPRRRPSRPSGRSARCSWGPNRRAV